MKSKILKNCIFGVDIDQQAVMVTKFSLSIKALEDSSHDEIVNDYTIFKMPILPNLDDNIKCGNSLIGSDFYNPYQKDMFNNREKREINTFDWDCKKGFPDIMKSGGFDVIIGNPPYINLKRGFITDREKNYLEKNYKTAVGQYDAFMIFIEKSISLLKDTGFFSLIVPKPVIASENYEIVRKRMLECDLVKICDTGSPFKGVRVETIVFILSKNNNLTNTELEKIDEKGSLFLQSVNKKIFEKLPYNNLSYLVNNNNISIFNKLSQCKKTLKDITSIFTRGIETGKTSQFINLKSNGKPLLRGEDLERYNIKYNDLFYTKNRNNIKEWKSEDIYQGDKIIIRRVADRILASYDNNNYYFLNTIYSLIPLKENNIKFILGIINSKLLSYYFNIAFVFDDKLFPYLRISQLEKLPMPSADFSNKSEKQLHDKLVGLVEQMLANQKYMHESKTNSDKEIYGRICDHLDSEIDKIVYKLYDLTDEEISIIES